MKVRSLSVGAGVALLAFSSAPALAELPEPVREMLEAAIATGDPRKVETVADIARQTNPAGAAEIDELLEGFRQERARLAEKQAQEKEAAIRSAGLFQNWRGNVELGASRSTGNSDDIGLTLGLRLNREGIDWKHRLIARADKQRSRGITTRERVSVTYEPQYTISEGLFAYGLGQFESDRFQGFDARYALSGGLGYRLVDSENVKLAVKAGPAWRRTEFVVGDSVSSIAALAGFDFEWAINERLKLTKNANMLANAGSSATIIIDRNNTSLNLVTGLDARVNSRISTRLSYTIDYNSNPPAGAVTTDTLSRFSLVYGF